VTPLVAVIIPCRNEAAFIERALHSILANDYPRLEVIVADGRSSDGTRELLERIAAREPRLRVVDNPERITPVALNLAIAAAAGEIVVRFDAHAVMPPDYIRRCVNLLFISGADNAGGSIRTVAQSQGPFAGPIVEVLSSPFGVGNSGFRTHGGESGPRPSDTVFGGCWRRELFARIGGFNEQLIRSQDIEFNLRIARAGGTIMLDPSIVSDYYARTTLRAFWSHNFLNGVWAVLPFAFSDIVPVRPRHLVPLAFVMALTISAALPVPSALAVPVAYASFNLAISAGLAIRRRRPGYLALLPVAFAALHLAYGLGSAWGTVQLLARRLGRSRPRMWSLDQTKLP
jgi:cellulose synthase/poly-beta-1,6-N-acetylglucosamine synthase-like glycosyltransferase